MESESRNLQNDFFNAARKSRAMVTVYLGNGKKLTGRIKSFDKFTVLLDGSHGEQMIFKHAISTVNASSRGDDDARRREQDATPARAAERERG